jgi:hypothetical protein
MHEKKACRINYTPTSCYVDVLQRILISAVITYS